MPESMSSFDRNHRQVFNVLKRRGLRGNAIFRHVHCLAASMMDRNHLDSADAVDRFFEKMATV